jgi:uncharacterized MAPEG superfamily protein
MKKNMGTFDKIVRILIAVAFAVLVLTKVVTGTMSVVLLILAAVFVITSLVSICPLYLPFGLNTGKK